MEGSGVKIQEIDGVSMVILVGNSNLDARNYNVSLRNTTFHGTYKAKITSYNRPF